MENVDIRREGNKLHILVDVSPETIAAAGASKSGKTRIIASTNGTGKVDLGNGNIISVGLNVYTK